MYLLYFSMYIAHIHDNRQNHTQPTYTYAHIHSCIGLHVHTQAYIICKYIAQGLHTNIHVHIGHTNSIHVYHTVVHVLYLRTQPINWLHIHTYIYTFFQAYIIYAQAYIHSYTQDTCNTCIQLSPHNFQLPAGVPIGYNIPDYFIKSGEIVFETITQNTNIIK